MTFYLKIHSVAASDDNFVEVSLMKSCILKPVDLTVPLNQPKNLD